MLPYSVSIWCYLRWHARSCSVWSSCIGRGGLRAAAAVVLSKPLLVLWVWQKSHPRASEQSCLAIFQQSRFLGKHCPDTKTKWDLPPMTPSKDSLEIEHSSLHPCLFLGSKGWPQQCDPSPTKRVSFFHWLRCLLASQPPTLGLMRRRGGPSESLSVSGFFGNIFPGKLGSIGRKWDSGFDTLASICQASLLLFFIAAHTRVLREKLLSFPENVWIIYIIKAPSAFCCCCLFENCFVFLIHQCFTFCYILISMFQNDYYIATALTGERLYILPLPFLFVVAVFFKDEI